MFKRKPFMWEINYTDEFDDSQEDFVRAAMSENLNHARHVENERMNLLVGISALIAGVLAVGGSIITNALSSSSSSVFYTEMSIVILIFVVIIMVLVLAKRLNSRWNTAFDRHIYYAKSCYYLLHRSNFELNGKGSPDSFNPVEDDLTNGTASSQEEADYVSKTAFKEEFKISAHNRKKTLDTMPLYCFDINKTIDDKNHVDTRSTKKYFSVFYEVLIYIAVLIVAMSIVIMLLHAFIR